MNITSTIVKFSVFVLTMSLVVFGLVVVFGNLRFESQSDYHADFSSVSGLKTGQFVRIAGVEVGRVQSVDISNNTQASVSFSLDSDVRLSQGTKALVRYENLVGDRYLELSEGPGSPNTLPPGSTIAIENTSPALDLDALIGGFRPLFKALDPDQVNKLSGELIEVFQGQGGTIANVLSQTAALTSTLADRDQLIGSVISNLNAVLATVDSNDEKFDSMIDNLQQIVTRVADQANPVSDALAHVSDASGTVASLLNATRPTISADINQLNRLATNIDDDRDYLDSLLAQLPEDYLRLSRLGLYGDFFSFYLCDVTLKVNGKNGDPEYIQVVGQRAGRCTP
ncbi:MCE family protein [Rhodococcus qingshengii]|uniref:MCE family protein n=1 Tax=Rhodococcus qingshengii TaxID=334542 RepID=UPI0024B92AAE|nr:MCE family protein [Rhodococcus qingshengii]MDJ0441105.1 MCE family protein [Rhodococcus qingshengii]